MPLSERERLVERVLGDPELYPDAFPSWLIRFLEGHPLLRLEEFQLPSPEPTKYIGEEGVPAFQNSWVNYTGGYDTAGFYRDPFGRVFLTGMVKDGTSGTTIFTLPGKYRPRARERFTNNSVVIDITGDGEVIHISGSTSAVPLSGISFRAFA